MRDSIRRRYLKELEEEKMLIHMDNFTIKKFKSDNTKVNAVVQEVDDEGAKL